MLSYWRLKHHETREKTTKYQTAPGLWWRLKPRRRTPMATIHGGMPWKDENNRWFWVNYPNSGEWSFIADFDDDNFEILNCHMDSVWVNYYTSLTWIKAIKGDDFPYQPMIPSEVVVRSLYFTQMYLWNRRLRPTLGVLGISWDMTPATFASISHLLLELHPKVGHFRKLTCPRAAGLEKPCMASWETLPEDDMAVSVRCCWYQAPDLFFGKFV